MRREGTGRTRAGGIPSGDLTLTRLRLEDVPAAARLFARAFDSDDIARLVTPDPRARRRFQERGGRVQIERAIPYGHVFAVYEDGDARGIAVWLPPGVRVQGSVAPPLNSLPRLIAAVARNAPAAMRLTRERRRGLKTAEARGGWHLGFLASDPAHQRRGIGTRLLTHVLDRADADGTPVWLETSDPANLHLYEKFGFETAARAEGGARLPTFWVMVRPPAGSRGSTQPVETAAVAPDVPGATKR